MTVFCLFADGSETLSDNSPGAASITSAEIANEFAGLSNEEQDRLRAEWSQVKNQFDRINHTMYATIRNNNIMLLSC